MNIFCISTYIDSCPRCGSTNVRSDGGGGRVVWIHCNQCGLDWEADNEM